MNFLTAVSQKLSINQNQVQAVASLLEEGGTVPFIARYRKEKTGNLDEVAITNIRDTLQQLKELESRRATVLKSIEEQGKLTKELKDKILAAVSMVVLEDIYLPFRPKRRTKATIAREKGLEPLAQIIFEQTGVDPLKEAVLFIDAEKGVASSEDALAGARDIIAEWVNEDMDVREKLRVIYKTEGYLVSKVLRGKNEDVDASKYKDYFDLKELAAKAPSHRILAVRRGEKEGFLSFRIEIEEDKALQVLQRSFVKGKGDDSYQVVQACEDSFKRLLSLSLETEMRLELKKRADKEAIEIFAQNLRELLMASPLGQKSVLAVDPGLRTGCKIVCLDQQGRLLHHDVVYLSGSSLQQESAVQTFKKLVKEYHIDCIAIGNGTASRETEAFIRAIGLAKDVLIIMVNESGASIYSASDAAREEFPDYDITVRGAVSIGRRLMDPLAELVKIDPKSIGVGQYQHDVDQTFLQKGLDDVVISSVNQVGVELNTASKQLLSYVSGLGPSRAQAVIEHRNKHGAFKCRDDLRRVSGFGPKIFEQAAGFLRVLESENPLDRSAVHPESYGIVELMAEDLKTSVNDLIQDSKLIQKIDLKNYVTGTIGLPTLTDIKDELLKPGRDPRAEFKAFEFADVHSIEDLSVGMKLPGIVTNVTAFGAFVDIGVHQDGLVHISELADHFVKDPHKVVKVNQTVNVTVLEVDEKRKRIALSLRSKSS